MTDRRRLLVVSPFPPSHEALHGGGRLVAETIEQLATRHRVALLTLRDPDEPGVGHDTRAVLDHVVEVERHAIGLSPTRLVEEPGRVFAVARRDPSWVVASEVRRARRELRDLVAVWQPDVVQIEFLAMARYSGALGGSDVPVVLVHHDAAPDGRDEPTRAWVRHARRTLPRIDALVVFTDEDRARAESMGAKAVHVIRPGVTLPPVAPQENASGAVFVGAFLHAPNVDAARRLVDVIHPLVRERLPNVELTIVGADPPRDLRDRPGVRLTGRVPDVGPYVDAAAVVVAPLALGAGVRVKVLDALARGKALVATSRAVEGLEVRDGVHAVIRDTDREFADAVSDLLGDAEARRRLGAAARAWAEAHLSWEVALDRYDRLYEELMPR